MDAMPVKNIKNQSHTTENEIKFIQKIGTFNEQSARSTQRDLLANYLKGCARRVNWGDMEKGKVIAFAKERLAAA